MTEPHDTFNTEIYPLNQKRVHFTSSYKVEYVDI